MTAWSMALKGGCLWYFSAADETGHDVGSAESTGLKRSESTRLKRSGDCSGLSVCPSTMSFSHPAHDDDQQSFQAALALLADYDVGDDLFTSEREVQEQSLYSTPDSYRAAPPPPPLPFAPQSKPPGLIAPLPAPPVSIATNKPTLPTTSDDNDDEDDEDTAEGSSSSTSPTAATQPAPPTRTGPKRVRKRQKDELIYLRSRVNELEERLERLQKRSRIPPSPTLSNATTASLTSSGEEELPARFKPPVEKPSAQLASVWEKVAKRQSEQRQEAEVENATLKEMLEEQIRVARSLERLLRKRANTDLLTKTRGNKLFKWNRVATKEEEAAMYQDMMRGLEEQYSEVDLIFTPARFASRGAIFRDIQVRMTDEDAAMEDGQPGEMYVDVLDSKILPFDLASTAAAFWKHMTLGQSTTIKSLAREVVELTDDTMARNFAVEIQAGPMRGEFRGKQCVRRYVSEDRVIIVWNMLAEPINFNGAFMGGLLMRQKAYVELTRSSEDPTQATQLRARYTMTPDVYDDDGDDQQRKVGSMTDFVIHMTHGNLNSSHQMIENILIATSLLKNEAS